MIGPNGAHRRRASDLAQNEAAARAQIVPAPAQQQGLSHGGAQTRGSVLAAVGVQDAPPNGFDVRHEDIGQGVAEGVDEPDLGEFTPFVEVHDVVQAEQRQSMAVRGEPLGHVAANAARGGVGICQLGMLALKRREFAEQRVVLGVVDLRAVEDVVTMVVIFEQRAQLLYASEDFRRKGVHNVSAMRARSAGRPMVISVSPARIISLEPGL